LPRQRSTGNGAHQAGKSARKQMNALMIDGAALKDPVRHRSLNMSAVDR
jgi:hypothetical protein